ncbi:hypothetical protein Tco_1331274 [Tanacetum coccineum]
MSSPLYVDHVRRKAGRMDNLSSLVVEFSEHAVTLAKADVQFSKAEKVAPGLPRGYRLCVFVLLRKSNEALGLLQMELLLKGNEST